MKKIILLLCTAALCLPLFGTALSCSEPNNDSIAISTESFSVSRGELAYFFVRSMQTALSSYTEDELSALGYDRSLSPSEQSYDGEKSWYDLFLQSTLDYVNELLVLCEAAKRVGMKVDGSDRLDQRIAAFMEKCENEYSVSFEQYLNAVYYGYVDEQSYADALALELLANKYLASVSDGFYDGVTDSRIKEYIAAEMADPDKTPTRDILYILLSGDNKEKADSIMGNLDATDFESAAKEHSESGELRFENCKKGELAKALDEWLYASERVIGDIGKVTLGDNVYILLYEKEGAPICELDARAALAKKDYENYLSELYTEFPIITDQKIIDSLDI